MAIDHPHDDVLRRLLLEHGVSKTGTLEFMQELVVGVVPDRHALRVLLWRFAMSMTTSTDLPAYDYSKTASSGRSLRGR